MEITSIELIDWCRKESNRFAQMQGDKKNTNRRRKSFRYRNHLFVEIADRLEAAENKLKAISELTRYAVNENIDKPNNYPLYAHSAGSWLALGDVQSILKQETGNE